MAERCPWRRTTTGTRAPTRTSTARTRTATRRTSTGRDEYGKDEYGKDEYGKDEYGKDEYGKDEYGKDEHEKGWKGGHDKPHGGVHTGGGALASVPGVTAGGLAVLAVAGTGLYALRRQKASQGAA
ncbi:hypothetical protein [Streptomyces sp. NRRL S-455]|uniref:hypothetical protein n=1 Tax=Streptomyces sp. NRRL S-455 TaxID=1463908 RepID=UPI000B2C7BAE